MIAWAKHARSPSEFWPGMKQTALSWAWFDGGGYLQRLRAHPLQELAGWLPPHPPLGSRRNRNSRRPLSLSSAVFTKAPPPPQPPTSCPPQLAAGGTLPPCWTATAHNPLPRLVHRRPRHFLLRSETHRRSSAPATRTLKSVAMAQRQRVRKTMASGTSFHDSSPRSPTCDK